MPWIESHSVLLRHRKLGDLARELRIRPVYVMGHLHALWHAALEQQEDGDLSSWSDEFIAESSSFPGDATQYVSLLQKYNWLSETKLIHDWLDYVGLYLTKKYSSGNKPKLVGIWQKHGRTYGVNEKRTKSEPEATLPNPPTNPPEYSNAPTLEQVKTLCSMSMIPPEVGEAWFYDHDGRPRSPRGYFTDRDGNEVAKWDSTLRGYAVKWRANNERNKQNANRNPSSKPRVDGNAGTANDGKASQYRGVGKVG